MKILLSVIALSVSASTIASTDWEFSSANRAETKNQYLQNMKKNPKATATNVLSNVEESLILQTRFMDETTKTRFINRFNKIQGTNYNAQQIDQLSELYADRKQMASERNSNETVVAYQFNSMDEREQALEEQAERQKQTRDRASSIEKEGLDFMKDLKSKNKNF